MLFSSAHVFSPQPSTRYKMETLTPLTYLPGLSPAPAVLLALSHPRPPPPLSSPSRRRGSPPSSPSHRRGPRRPLPHLPHTGVASGWSRRDLGGARADPVGSDWSAAIRWTTLPPPRLALSVCSMKWRRGKPGVAFLSRRRIQWRPHAFLIQAEDTPALLDFQGRRHLRLTGHLQRLRRCPPKARRLLCSSGTAAAQHLRYYYFPSLPPIPCSDFEFARGRRCTVNQPLG